MWGRALPLLLTVLFACGPRVKSSGVASGPGYRPNQGPVVIKASEIPPGAIQVGVAQAYGEGAIDKLIPEFAARVARLGGNFGKVDDIRTKFELKTVTTNESYSCGTPQAPRQCTRMRTQTVEVATTTVLGRAFRVGESKR